MPNRITAATAGIPIKDLDALRARLDDTPFAAVEAAPAFSTAYDASPNRAIALARGFAATLSTHEDHRQLFQSVAGMGEEHRRALITGYRREGQGRGVVQAISLLPRAQGQALITPMPGDCRKRRAEPPGEIEPEIPPRTERAFNQQAEHQQENHVANQMFHTAVHEHCPQHAPRFHVREAQGMARGERAAANAIELGAFGMPVGVVRVRRIDYAIGTQRGEKFLIRFD